MLFSPGRRPFPVAPIKQITQSTPIPAPQKGINAVDGLIAMSPEEAIFMYNMAPSQYGTRVRTGYKEWVTSVDVNGVRTIIPYTASVSANDKLFAVGQAGFYDISSTGTAPALLLAFPSATSVSGFGIWTAYTTVAGHFSLYCDEQNGYYVYTEAGAWAKVALGGGANQVANIDPDLFVAVTIFKERAWFVERNSARAWYLPTGSIFGAATVFNFGNKFKKGGTLEALFNWTVDGGQGVDDYLVAVSSGGDVVVYKGSDPSVATDFEQHGVWFIGPPPVGRRIGGSFGGELCLLSSYGLLPMSSLVSGQLVQAEQTYLSRKITPLVNLEMSSTRTTRGWEVKLISKENTLIISTPKREAFPFSQFAQSTNNQGWSIYRDIPYLNGEEWHGNFYIAAANGTAYILQDNLDNVSLNGLTSTLISWSVLQAFSDVGEPGLYHIPQYVRPVFISEQVPAYGVEIHFDYNLSAASGSIVPGGSSSGTLWDVGIWDLSLWGGDFITADNPQGADGIGRAMAIALNGQSGAETILVRHDLMFTTGNML
jgi:hypothetical protein